MFQDDPLSQTYDAVVVGSGATGGWAAKRLSEAGLTVAVLEAAAISRPKNSQNTCRRFILSTGTYRSIGSSRAPYKSSATRAWKYNYDWFV